MKHKRVIKYLLRIVASTLSLKLATILLDQSIQIENQFRSFLIAGLVLATVNTIVKPIVIIFSLPAVMLTLGLFLVVINGFMVYLTDKIYSGITVFGFWSAIKVGLVVGLMNFVITAILDRENNRGQKS